MSNDSNDRKQSLIDQLPQMDKKKATKFVLYGLILAIVFGTVMLTSRSIANNNGTYMAIQNDLNEQAYWNGDYGYQDYLRRQYEIDTEGLWMQFQFMIFGKIIE